MEFDFYLITAFTHYKGPYSMYYRVAFSGADPGFFLGGVHH